jgi:hypothetical protein
MLRTIGCLLVIALWSVVAGWDAQSVQAQSGVDDGEVRLRFDRYEEKINALLKTRRNEEKQFIADVMAKVRAGEIPEPLIETSYKWVLNKKPDTKYPFVYFERVLRLQAEKVGVEIPAFDYEIYRTRVFRQ